jgi:hypothetical protein
MAELPPRWAYDQSSPDGQLTAGGAGPAGPPYADERLPSVDSLRELRELAAEERTRLLEAQRPPAGAILVPPSRTGGLDERDVEPRSAPLLGPEARVEASEEETAQILQGGLINNLRIVDELVNALQFGLREHAAAWAPATGEARP